MPTWLHNFWYDFCYSTVWAGFTLGSSLRFEGAGNVPATGPVLLVANHQSYLDPPAVGVAVRRRLAFLARKTLFKNPLFKTLLNSLRSVPVDQEGVAKEGLKAVLDLLEKGEGVLVFPEGERSWNGPMQSLKPGVLLLVKRAMPPIVPVGIAGAFDAWPRKSRLPRLSPLFMPSTGADVAVSFGKPIDGKSLAALPREEMLERLRVAIGDAKDRAERLRRKT